jgi:hypothetical protein
MKTIPCAKATDLIVMDLDEGLSSADKQVLEAHVQGCAHCRQWRDEAGGILTSIAADVPEDPGEEFWKYYETSLQARLRESESQISWSFLWKAIGAVAVAGTIFAVIWLGGFDPSAKRVGGDKVTWSPALIQEFEQLYGPEADETLASTVTGGHLISLAGATAPRSDVEVPRWFEVEDETNQLL